MHKTFLSWQVRHRCGLVFLWPIGVYSINSGRYIIKEGRISRDVEVSENVFAGFDRAGNLLEIQLLEVSREERPWLTLEAAAQYLHVSERTLLRWIKSGKLKPSKVGREYRIKPEDLKKIA